MNIPIESTLPEAITPPAPVAPVEGERAAAMIKLEPTVLAGLDAKVAEWLDVVMGEPAQSEAFKARVEAVHGLGSEAIRASARISSRLLQRPVRAMNSGAFDEGSAISTALLDLRNTVEELDPSRHGNLLKPRKLLGLIPLGNRVRDYFRRYQSAQAQLNAIIQSLYAGQDELRKDNAAIEEEKLNAWRTMEKLEQYVYVGKRIDAALEERLARIEADDPEKARVVREDLLFYVRQKVQDLLTQLAVTAQGYLAMEMIRKNNLELIKGVERATTTTVSALRTAVLVSQALADQKLVLDQIGALRTTADAMIQSSSARLKQQAGQVYEQAADAAASLDTLRQAFRNIYETMDMMANYKVQVLDNMKQTVAALTVEIDKAQSCLDETGQPSMPQDRETLRAGSGDDVVL